MSGENIEYKERIKSLHFFIDKLTEELKPFDPPNIEYIRFIKGLRFAVDWIENRPH
jgi:hypothetical protein